MNYEFDPTYTLIGFIRETEDQKVYLRTLDNLEGLYDYYVESGDTIDFYNPFLKYIYDMTLPDYGADTVVTVDDVYFENVNGIPRKVHKLIAYGNNSNCPELFYEGIGSLSGCYYAACFKFFPLIGNGISLLCAEDNGTLIYQNQQYGDCFITNSVEIQSNQLSIYPNPCDSKICITTQNNNKAQFCIIDMTGKIM